MVAKKPVDRCPQANSNYLLSLLLLSCCKILFSLSEIGKPRLLEFLIREIPYLEI